MSGVALPLVAEQRGGERTFIDRGDRFAQDRHAAPQNRDLVRDPKSFAETMRDENDASAAIREFSKPREQLRGFRGREDRRRLVEQKRRRVSRECFDDLESLLAADRQRSGEGIRVERQTGAFPDLEHRRRGALRAKRAARSERDVLGDGHRRHVREMLMNHSDTGGHRRRGRENWARRDRRR